MKNQWFFNDSEGSQGGTGEGPGGRSVIGPPSNVRRECDSEAEVQFRLAFEGGLKRNGEQHGTGSCRSIYIL